MSVLDVARRRVAPTWIPLILLASSFTAGAIADRTAIPDYDFNVGVSSSERLNDEYVTMRPISLGEARALASAALHDAERRRGEASAAEAAFWDGLGLDL